MAFIGKFLDVNLTDSTILISDLDEEVVRKFLAGRGLNSWLLYQNVGEEVDPLESRSILLFSCGLLTGTAAPASSRLHISSKSPLTGLMGNSNAGGGFAVELKSSGFHSIIVRGRADKPVFLFIHDGCAEIRDARSLWGLDTWKTEDRLKRDLGAERLKVVAIGPGGENLVPFASIMVDRDHAAGRTGMGAVMGSKFLKAIAVRGQEKGLSLDVSSASAVKDYIRKIRKTPRFREVSTYGSAIDVRWTNEMGMLATRNYRDVQFEDIDKIEGREIQRHVTRLKSCYRCPVHCKAEIAIGSGSFKGMKGTRPEFESVIALGSKCGLNRADAIMYFNDLCGRLGIDTISTGSVIAFAMDLYDREILTGEDTGGLELTWGNQEAMEELINLIVRREGLGGILSRGVREGAKIIGRGSERFAYHTKGLELTGYDPRGLLGTALGYAVSERGGDFNSFYATLEYRWSTERAEAEFGTAQAVNRLSPQGKGDMIKRAFLVTAVLDSLGICKVPALTLIGDFDLKNEALLTASMTGWNVNADDLMLVGERIVNLERLFNLRIGAEAKDDTVPGKFIEEAVDQGPAEGSKVQLEPMVRDFYRVMGWDEAGYPSEEKLTSLDLLKSPGIVRKRNLKVRKKRREISKPYLPVASRPVSVGDKKGLRRARDIR
ncbi:MAG: aldehyde ferredoxin oxidoreductase [Proteobacteria bacterium]|nr:aldehyde ferredoxin oxidoreductase [Pseudomonadota bacterium]